MTGTEPATAPQLPERIRTVAFWIVVALGLASFLVAGLARIWWASHYAQIEETAALVEGAIALIAGILGLGSLPFLTRGRT